MRTRPLALHTRAMTLAEADLKWLDVCAEEIRRRK
jgi:hypothetical protein